MSIRGQDSGILVAELERSGGGAVWTPPTPMRRLPASGLPGWQSNGGSQRRHPDRSLPSSFEIPLPDVPLTRIFLSGVYALHAEPEAEAPGTIGASIQLLSRDAEILARYDLVNGRHYFDACDLHIGTRLPGDGTGLENVGVCSFRDSKLRVDLLTVDVANGLRPKKLCFRDLGSPASFIVFDVFFESTGETQERELAPGTCLAESQLGAAVRVGDRVRFSRALNQLDAAIDEAETLDDARACALSFFAITTAALIETSPSRSETHLMLEMAREMDKQKSREEVKAVAHDRIASLTASLFAPSESPTDRLVDRAIAIVERHYAKDLTDSIVASQLGLSTSHFRFLFRQATGHPFHKYVVGLRLEKARQMLIEQELPVSQVATAVGFAGLSHFSRAFTQRFSASPSHIRRAAG